MPSIESLIAPGGLIREIALCYPPGDGLGCNILLRMVVLATLDMIPDDARKGIASLTPWAQLDPKWRKAAMSDPDWKPWDALYTNWVHKGSSVAIGNDATLTPGVWCATQYWDHGLETGGHVELERLSEDGSEVRRVQSGKLLGYRDEPLPMPEAFPRWKNKARGVLTVPAGV